MEPEPQWSDATLIIDLSLDVHTGVHRLVDYFEGNDGEEEVPEENS